VFACFWGWGVGFVLVLGSLLIVIVTWVGKALQRPTGDGLNTR